METFNYRYKISVGQTSYSVETRFKEHHHIRLARPEKSAVAEKSIKKDHKIRFQETRFLATKTGYLNHIIRKAVELNSDLKT
jgi:hypothetical protein